MAGGIPQKGGRTAEINVTPLVDVVLVLLIIFMVLSPASTTQVPNALPQAASLDSSAVLTSDQLVLELRAAGSATFNRQAISLGEFENAVRSILAGRTNRTVFVTAEDAVSYGVVVSWMAVARRAGATTVALNLNPPKVGEEP